MSVLSSIFDKTEALKKVPLIGDMLSGYNDAVIGLLNATDKVAGSLDRNRKQGMVGMGTPNYLYDPKYIAMKKQFGEAVADGNTWVPEGPSFVYRNSIDKNKGQIMIWDAKDNEWYKIDDGSKNIESVYNDGLMIGKQFTPHQLKVYADKWENIKQRNQEADQLFKRFNEIKNSTDYDVFEQLDIVSRIELRKLLGDPELFRNWYSLDQKKFQLIKKAKLKVSQTLEAKRKKEKLKRKATQYLIQKKSRIEIQPQPKKEAPVFIEENLPDKVFAAPSVPVIKSSSSTYCNELPGDMVNEINSRLASSTASEIASMSLKVLPKDERQSFMNCLCAATSTQSGSVSKYYELKPVGASSSCNEPANGSCVNQGMGCTRHPLRITQEALKSCNSGYKVATQLCQQGIR